MSSLLTAILDGLKEKGRVIEVVDALPDHGTWRPSYWVGGAHFSSADGDARIQTKSATKRIQDYPALAPEFARAYLNVKYGNVKLRCNRVQYHQAKLERPPSPLYARPNIEPEDMVYLDLKSAYWQILTSVGWDADYLRGVFLGVRSSNIDFPMPAWKLARNALVTVSLPTVSTMWADGGLRQVKIGQQNSNHIVWQLCQDVLHGIACDAVRAGAIYVHTDGYICRQRDMYNVWDAIASWGMTLDVKFHGWGWVKGVGAYLLSETKSGAYDRVMPRSFSNLYDPNVEFLRNRFRDWRSRVDPFEAV